MSNFTKFKCYLMIFPIEYYRSQMKKDLYWIFLKRQAFEFKFTNHLEKSFIFTCQGYLFKIECSSLSQSYSHHQCIYILCLFLIFLFYKSVFLSDNYEFINASIEFKMIKTHFSSLNFENPFRVPSLWINF